MVPDEVCHVGLGVAEAPEYLVRTHNLICRLVIVSAQVIHLDAEEDSDHAIEVILPTQGLILQVGEKIFPLLICLEAGTNDHRLTLNVREQGSWHFFRPRV